MDLVVPISILVFISTKPFSIEKCVWNAEYGNDILIDELLHLFLSDVSSGDCFEPSTGLVIGDYYAKLVIFLYTHHSSRMAMG